MQLLVREVMIETVLPPGIALQHPNSVSHLSSGILTEQETVQGILLLQLGCSKKSLQFTADGKKILVERWRIFLSSFCFLVVGYLFLVNLVIVILKADKVLELFYDIVALVRYFHSVKYNQA